MWTTHLLCIYGVYTVGMELENTAIMHRQFRKVVSENHDLLKENKEMKTELANLKEIEQTAIYKQVQLTKLEETKETLDAHNMVLLERIAELQNRLDSKEIDLILLDPVKRAALLQT